jgi:hypothetical protein
MADFSKSDPEELAHNFTLVHGAVLGNNDAPSDPVPSPASAVFELPPVLFFCNDVGLSMAGCVYEITRSYDECG